MFSSLLTCLFTLKRDNKRVKQLKKKTHKLCMETVRVALSCFNSVIMVIIIVLLNSRRKEESKRFVNR